MIPFYIYYSMFGLQRVGDLAWLAGDMRARGFLLGGTAGRTTLNGEGLQHEDGHSHILASTIPDCVSYDPTFAYEVVVIIREGIRRMYEAQEDVYYYVTLMNENYAQPGDAGAGAEAGDHQGPVPAQGGRQVRQEGGPARAADGQRHDPPRGDRRAPTCCASDFGVEADLWSATSFNELRRDGMSAERYNLLHPTARAAQELRRVVARRPRGPGVAATDYMRNYADQIREPRAAALRHARHRRLRPQRLPRQAAPLLRGRIATTSPSPR